MSQSQQSQATALKQKALELIEKYSKIGLKTCETKESQVWRDARGGQATNDLYLNS